MINLNPIHFPSNKYTDAYFQEVRDRSTYGGNFRGCNHLFTKFKDGKRCILCCQLKWVIKRLEKKL